MRPYEELQRQLSYTMMHDVYWSGVLIGMCAAARVLHLDHTTESKDNFEKLMHFVREKMNETVEPESLRLINPEPEPKR